jgi:hypothetical protein
MSASGWRQLHDQLAQNLVRIDPIGLGVKMEQNPVS